MKNKIIKPIVIIASLTLGLLLTSCDKECLSEFKKEISNRDSTSSDNHHNQTGKK